MMEPASLFTAITCTTSRWAMFQFFGLTALAYTLSFWYISSAAGFSDRFKSLFVE